MKDTDLHEDPYERMARLYYEMLDKRSKSTEAELVDNWTSYSPSNDPVSSIKDTTRFKEGDTVYLMDTPKAQQWLNTYAGTDAKVVKIDSLYGCTVEAYDGRIFYCPAEFALTFEELYYSSPHRAKAASKPPPLCKHENTYVNRISANLAFKVCKDCKADLGDV